MPRKDGRVIVEAYPLACPFCDEMAYPSQREKRIVLPNKIYFPRECIMGHRFYSVEEIPENQADIVDEIKSIRKEAVEWKRNVYRDRKNRQGFRKSGEEEKTGES